MAPTKLTIHIRPGANPSTIIQLTDLLTSQPNLRFETVDEFLQFTKSHGLGSYSELKTVPTAMGLIEETPKKIQLSQLGASFSRIRKDVQPDILHFFMYISWHESTPLNFLPSWAYRNCCDRYWQVENLKLTSDYISRQVEETINEARTKFMQGSPGVFNEISFGPKSVEGAHKWLNALQPPVIIEKMFSRRAFCHPELMLLTIGYILKEEVDATEIDILLTKEKREAISRICLLDPNAFDQTLDWALSIFPDIISPGTTAGFYGRFIRLRKLPTLEDLVR